MSTPTGRAPTTGSEPSTVDGAAAPQRLHAECDGPRSRAWGPGLLLLHDHVRNPAGVGSYLGFFAVAVFPRMNFFIAILISGLVSVPVWTLFAEFTARFPKLGGDYVINSRILHPAIGFGVNLGQSSLKRSRADSLRRSLRSWPSTRFILIIGVETGNHTIASWANYFTIEHRWVVFLSGTVAILLISVLAAIRTKLLFRVMTAMCDDLC